MLVAHQDDHITHAVIGGKKQINFGISDDPAFFQILSSALYKDPMLAMVRETICNAWDAHIECGRVDQPILITLDDDYLTIRDHGNGILDAMIGPIYGVYGASTKKNDGRQTGGFGLGCKSPFAYTDHFEVTSSHAGTKTIYNMSKSSAQVQGKPSIVPIASFPTTESGITVKIPLNPEKHNNRLQELIRQVVFNGDIRALFNGTQLPILGLDESECGLVLLNQEANSRTDISHFDKGRIYVRYGNVIYPIEKSSEFGELYDKVSNLLNRYYSCKLVMLAPPDSISITPSREALTMSNITVDTVKKLLIHFLAVFFKNQELMHRHKTMVYDYVDNAAERDAMLHMKLPLGEWIIPGIPNLVQNKILKTTDQFAFLEVLLRYSGRRGTLQANVWFKFITRYLWNLQAKHNFDKGLLHRWFRTMQQNLKKVSNPNGDYYLQSEESEIATEWWRKNILAPLVQELMKTFPGFDRKSMYFLSNNIEHKSYKEKEMIPVSQVVMNTHTHNLVHLLTPTVILCHNAKMLHRRLKNANEVNLGCSGSIVKNAYFAIEVSRKKDVAEKALEKLKLIQGIEVLDLTGRLPNEQTAYEERQAEILKVRADAAAGKKIHIPLVKKNKAGLVQFNYILDKANNRIDTKIFSEALDPDRLTKPEFVVLIATGKESRHDTPSISAAVLHAAARLYGDKGAVTNRSDTYDKYIENGAMDFNLYLVQKILHDVSTSPTLLEYHSTDPIKMEKYIHSKLGWYNREPSVRFVEMLLQNPAVQHLMPAVPVLSDEDQYRWVIWKELRQITPHSKRADLTAIEKQVEAIPLKQEIIDFLDKLIVNPFLGLIDVNSTSELLRTHQNDPVATSKIVAVIQTILS